MNDAQFRIDPSSGSERMKEVRANGETGCSCSEAVLAAYADSFGLSRKFAIKIAAGFGGGMGLRGDVCGAVTAAYMVLGLAFGTADAGDGYTRQKTYMMIDEFAERFIDRMGALECRRLCAGYSMATPEGARALRESGRPSEIISAAAEILESLLCEEIE